jgi:hypothetical protein
MTMHDVTEADVERARAEYLAAETARELQVEAGTIDHGAAAKAAHEAWRTFTMLRALLSNARILSGAWKGPTR